MYVSDYFLKVSLLSIQWIVSYFANKQGYDFECTQLLTRQNLAQFLQIDQVVVLFGFAKVSWL